MFILLRGSDNLTVVRAVAQKTTWQAGMTTTDITQETEVAVAVAVLEDMLAMNAARQRGTL